jgi:peptidyl-prolyl cis-trans isomerase C
MSLLEDRFVIFRLVKFVVPLLLLTPLAACAGAPATTAAQAEIVEVAQVIEPTQNAQPSPVIQPTVQLQPTAAEDNGLPVDEAGEELVASVNGEGITLEIFQRTLQRNQIDVQAADEIALESTVLDSLIEQAVIEQAAAEQNISIDPAELDAQFQMHVQQAGSDQAWQQWLAQNQYTEQEFRDMLRSNIITGRVIAEVTQDLAGNVPQVHARHILVRTEAEASDALARLQAGEDFAALAGAISIDVTTRDQGGDLGWFTQEELLETNLAEIAFDIEPGQIAGPVPTRLGYHIIQSIERADRPVPPEKLPTVAQIRFENWLASQVENATIERFLS